MTDNKTFRSALNGFNREDVVQYIAYINNKHTSLVNQLTTEIQVLTAELTQLREQPDLSAELEASQAKCAALEQELEQLHSQAETHPLASNELETYRRAENAERVANERITQLCQQANGALADATVRVDETAMRISDLSDKVSAQISEMQAVLASSKNALKDAAASMYAVRPISSQK